MDAIERFKLHTAIFVTLSLLYATRSPLLHTLPVQLVAVALLGHLLYTTYTNEKSGDEQPIPVDNGADAVEDVSNEPTLVAPDDVSSKWYTNFQTSKRALTTPQAADVKGFYDSVIGASVRKSMPLCTRSFSSFNPYHSYD